METKREIKVAKGTQITRTITDDDGNRTFAQVTTISDDDGFATPVSDDCRLRLDYEGKAWVRGWTGPIVTAFKRTIVAEDRKRKLDKSKRERDESAKRTAVATKRLQEAAAAVKQAKLPRELRPIAFMALLGPYPTAMMMRPWM